MASESTSSQQSQQLLLSLKVNFMCEEGIIAFNNAIALLEHPNELYRPMLSFLSNCCINKALTLQPSAIYVDYLKEFLYTPEVEEETKTITFSLSWWDERLSFTQDEFISAIRLPTCNDAIPLPPKETVKVGLATLGLFDKDKPTLSSSVLVNSSPLKMNNDLTLVKPHTIIDASFQKPLAYEVPLTSHMLKVAKLSEEPEQSLIPPSGEVNADDIVDKSLSRASVQPVTQSKAPTDLMIKKKKTPPSSKTKSPYKVRVILPKKQVTETQHAEVTVATADATQSLEASESAEEQVNQPTAAEAEKVLDQKVEVVEGCWVYKYEDYSEEQSLEFPQLSSLAVHAFADKPIQSYPLGHLHEELCLLNNKVNQLESSITKHVSDSIQSTVPLIVTNTLKEQMSGLLSDALKDILPQLIKDSIKSSVSESIVEELPQVEAQIREPKICFTSKGAEQIPSHQNEEIHQTESPHRDERKKALVLHTLEEKSSEEDTSGKKETNDEPPAKKLKFLIPSSLLISSPTPLKTIMPDPPKFSEAIKMTLDQFTKHLSKTTSSIFSPTPPKEPTPPKDQTPLRDKS
ncbi:hypothetical protein Tco_0146331 [Tanacetum coccineum]